MWLDTHYAWSQDRNQSKFTLDLVSANKRTTVAKGIIRYHLATVATAASVCLHFYTLSATRVLNSFEELCIMRAAAENSFARVLNPPWESVYIYIYIYTNNHERERKKERKKEREREWERDFSVSTTTLCPFHLPCVFLCILYYPPIFVNYLCAFWNYMLLFKIQTSPHWTSVIAFYILLYVYSLLSFFFSLYKSLKWSKGAFVRDHYFSVSLIQIS